MYVSMSSELPKRLYIRVSSFISHEVIAYTKGYNTTPLGFITTSSTAGRSGALTCLEMQERGPLLQRRVPGITAAADEKISRRNTAVYSLLECIKLVTG